MGKKVLVLNSDYRAMSVCSVNKAFLLVFMDKAEVVSKADNLFLRTVSMAYPLPSVIRLRRYVNIPYKGVVMSRQNIFKRDGNCCVYCGSRKDLTLDHVLPKSRNGKSSWTNLVTACQKCNSKKGDLTPEEANMRLPYQPYKPSFILFMREIAKMGDHHWRQFLD